MIRMQEDVETKKLVPHIQKFKNSKIQGEIYSLEASGHSQRAVRDICNIGQDG